MSLKDLAQPEPWMDQEERQTAATLIAAFQQDFAGRGIPENPFLTLRLQDCLLHYTLCRRLEQRSLVPGSEELTPALAAHVGRARERLRRALKDLEDTAKRLAPPAESCPKPAETAGRSMKRRDENPKLPETPAPNNTASGDTPQDQNQSSTAAVPSPSPSPSPIPPMTPIPPPNSIPPTQRPRPTPQPVIHVPRPVPFAQQHRK